MKRFLSLLLIMIGLSSSAQVVNIPDANFKNFLVNYADLFGRAIDVNNDDEIQVSEAVNFCNSTANYLQIGAINITDITGIEAFSGLRSLTIAGNNFALLDLSNFTDLETLFCHSNHLTSLNLSGCTKLRTLICENNNLSSISVSGLTALESLSCNLNPISLLDLSGNALLQQLFCDNCQLSSLDLSQNPLLNKLGCANNQLVSLNVKNNAVFDYASSPTNFALNASGNPNLQYVCADNGEVLYLLNYFVNNGMGTVQVDQTCSSSTSPGYGTLNGIARVDIDINGCNASDDGKILLPLKMVNDADPTQTYFFKADSSGIYNVHAYPGNFTISPQSQIPYFSFSPASIPFTSTNGCTQNINFCIVPNGALNDLDVKIDYGIGFLDGTGRVSLTYKNKGTTILSGNVQLQFEDSKMDFVSAIPAISNQSTGAIGWDFTNLQPFESRQIEVSLFLLPWPVNSVGDTLEYTASINPQLTDQTPLDNVYSLRAPVTFVVLPINIEYFKGAIQQGRNLLNWKASCTSIQAVFNIEKSTDGRNYTSIYNITASNTRCLQPFDFVDANPVAGINYYRIKMTDVDGKVSYSNIIALLNKKAGFEIVNMVPNPVTHGTALLNLTSAKKQVININVTDAAGKTVQSAGQSIIAGFTQLNMNFNKLAAGIYTIILYTDDGERKTTQFVKQ